MDDGPEFTGRSLDVWGYFNGATLNFSRQGKPTDAAYIEELNARLRQECPGRSRSLCLEDSHAKIEAWEVEYNTERPHGAVGDPAPGEFARRWAGEPAEIGVGIRVDPGSGSGSGTTPFRVPRCLDSNRGQR